MRKGILSCILAVTASTGAWGQSSPIYQVTVVERNVQAINYQYRTGPTKIDFRGTVLLSAAKGDATVESKPGRTDIDLKLEGLLPPTRFGHEYLTYVLWAISPEGSPRNLGEVIANGSNNAKLRVTTDLQAFGLIVTAEPYSAVRRLSDVVVMENYARPDTVGKVQFIQAKYELMPRGQYTWQVPDGREPPVPTGPKVSMEQYEALLELYQAQNAIGIAQAAHAADYAGPTFAKAQQLLAEAQRLQSIRATPSLIVQNAREAAQTAEDARIIAQHREQEQTVAKARSDTASDSQRVAKAEAEAQRARAEAEAARAQLAAERTQREKAEMEAAVARGQPVLSQPATAEADRIALPSAPAYSQPQEPTAQQKSEARIRLFERFNAVMTTRDTPRGLTITIPDAAFSGGSLRPAFASSVARVAAVIQSQPNLQVAVEGHTDSSTSEGVSWKRAEAVRNVLLQQGLNSNSIALRGLGNTRPLAANSTPAGRLENRRVEVIISGDPIGSVPFWDHTYKLK